VDVTASVAQALVDEWRQTTRQETPDASPHRITSRLLTTNRPQLLQLTVKDAALVAMVNLPVVRGAQARRVLDAVFPAFGKWDHVVD
jgi:hypothetical protein